MMPIDESFAWEEGYACCLDRRPRTECPYADERKRQWFDGYDTAERQTIAMTQIFKTIDRPVVH